MNKDINSLIRAINNRSKNQEIIKNQDFDISNNEIGMLLG